MRRLVGLALVLSVAACTGTSGAPGVPQGATVEYAVSDRRPAPTVSGELLGGGTKALADLRGDVVVVNFWASWCAPCRVEAGDLERTYQATKGSGVSFLGINTRDERDQADQFVRAEGTTFPSLFDPAGKLALGFANAASTLPATIIIDRSGRIAVVLRVSVREPDLRAFVDRLAAEPRGLSAPTYVGIGSVPWARAGGGRHQDDSSRGLSAPTYVGIGSVPWARAGGGRHQDDSSRGLSAPTYVGIGSVPWARAGGGRHQDDSSRGLSAPTYVGSSRSG